MYRNILRQYWGYDDFRGIQREIIESIGAGHDTLGLMPTGGGKSICFQVPALSMDGTCIVVTPLISLMKDQVDNLRKRNITAYAIHAGLSRNEIVKILDNCIYGDIKFLYISPERIGSELFQIKLKHIKVSFITVDEAHCISQWGYDFRPAYLNIADIRKISCRPILALTATATPDVVEDIQKQLGFEDGNVFRMSFVRDNLTYVVRNTTDKEAEIIHILNSVQGSAIVYTMSRKKTRDICRVLVENGISADYYHAGLDIAVKTKRQNDWQQGTTRVIVATNAFGMGIDKPDVRIVIHADVPTSIEAFFQEAGRGGRDGKRSYAVLLTSSQTPAVLKQRLSQSFPSKEFIRDVYEHLAYFYEIGIGMGKGHTFLFSMGKFCHLNKYSPILVDAAMKILDNAGYITYNTEPDSHSRLLFTVSRDDLYQLRELPQELDELILTLMRTYTGLFTDYAYIDEKALATILGTTPERVYMLLTDLRRRHIVKFIPPRTDPTVTYNIDRVDGCNIILRDAIYAQLQGVMNDHITAMIDYIENVNVCRQKQLVQYFGDENTEDCGTCEVCRAKKKDNNNKEQARDAEQKAREAVLKLLADGEKHLVKDVLKQIDMDKDTVKQQIDILLSENKIKSDSIYLSC